MSNTTLPIQTGNPAIDAQYVAYVEADLLPAYVRPLVLMWNSGEWWYPMSDVKYRPKVYGWSGPLIVGKLAEIFRNPERTNFTGLLCPECELPQFTTPSGVTCANGHGGCEGMEREYDL